MTDGARFCFEKKKKKKNGDSNLGKMGQNQAGN